MQFSSFLAAAALSGLASAVVQLSNTVYNDITAGKTYSIGWINATGPVTLSLKNGGANNLQTFSTITSGATTSPFAWNVPSSLPADTYAIEISDGSATNYSPQFQLLGATASASASTASSTGSSTASSSVSSSISSSLVSTSTSVVPTLTANSTSSTATSASNSTASTTGSSSGSSTGSASKTSTAVGGSKTSSSASSSSSVPATNSATEFASPLALVLFTFAAILTLN